MGNTADKQNKNRLLNSKFRWKVSQFIDKYGNISGQAAKKWIDETIADNFHSVTYTKFSDPTYRNSKNDLLAGFEKAYRGKWRMSLIMFVDVTKINGQETIIVRYKNNVPHVKNPGHRVDLFFQCIATFNQNTGLWVRSRHEQYIPQSQQLRPIIQNNKNISTSTSQKQDNRQEQRRRANRVRQQQRQRAEREARYRQQQKKFQQNMRRQEQQQRQYRRQQQLQAQQRQRQIQQAIIKRNY